MTALNHCWSLSCNCEVRHEYQYLVLFDSTQYGHNGPKQAQNQGHLATSTGFVKDFGTMLHS